MTKSEQQQDKKKSQIKKELRVLMRRVCQIAVNRT